MITRPGAVSRICSSASPTRVSDGVTPVLSAYVESEHSSRTPSCPNAARRCRSVGSDITGVWSILKSPVWTTNPAGVRRAMPNASGIECATGKNSAVMLPKSKTEPLPASIILASRIPLSSSRQRINPSASGEA